MYIYFFSSPSLSGKKIGYGTGSSRKSSYVKQPLLQQRVNLPVHYGHNGLRGFDGKNQVVSGTGSGTHVGSNNHHTETMTGNVGSSSTSSGGNSGDERWYVTSFVKLFFSREIVMYKIRLIFE